MKIKLVILTLLTLCLSASAYTPGSCWWRMGVMMGDYSFVTFNTGYSQTLENGVLYEYSISNRVTVTVTDDVPHPSLSGLPRVLYHSYHADWLGIGHNDGNDMEILPMGCRVMTTYAWGICFTGNATCRSTHLEAICTNAPSTNTVPRPALGTNFFLGTTWQCGNDWVVSVGENEEYAVEFQMLMFDGEEFWEYDDSLFPGESVDTATDSGYLTAARGRYLDPVFGDPVSDWSDPITLHP